jgi:hypothetical protein
MAPTAVLLLNYHQTFDAEPLGVGLLHLSTLSDNFLAALREGNSLPSEHLLEKSGHLGIDAIPKRRTK